MPDNIINKTITNKTITNNDLTQNFQDQVKQSIEQQSPLFIHGGKSKLFYGNPVDDAESLDVSPHSGVIDYEPSELCITVRAGTLLSELENLLANQQQILPFEPPYYSKNATIGGAVAAGIAGPRRAYTGSVRDSILGVQIINGNGEVVTFGGQVMKNVAGYDLSRLMVRSQGTLGVILNVSLRLLPKPESNMTITFEAKQAKAIEYFKSIRSQQYPITATAWHENQVYLRLSASENILHNCMKNIKGDKLNKSESFWQNIRDHKHPFFLQDDRPLWRFSLPPSSDKFSPIEHTSLIEWGGAQHWMRSNAPVNIIQSLAASQNGYVTLFQGNVPSISRLPILDENLLKLHKSIKKKMDPHNIFNPNRIYHGL